MAIARKIKPEVEASSGMPLPAEGVLAGGAAKVGGERQMVEGMLAMGVPLGEALQPFAKAMGVDQVIALAGEFTKDGPEQMRVLCELQKAFRDKKAFGQACLKAGFHPAGVALAGVTYQESGDTALSVPVGVKVAGVPDVENGRAMPAAVNRAKRLLEAFGVDGWLGERLDRDWLTLDADDVKRLGSINFIVTCDLKLELEGVPSGRVVSIPWLKEAGRGLVVVKGDVAWPFLTKVKGGFIMVDGNVEAPRLREVGSICVAHTKNHVFPSLVCIHDGINAFGAEDLSLPALREIRGWAGLGNSSGVSLPLLERVSGEMELGNACSLSVPILTGVGGNLVARHAVDITFDKLSSVGGDLDLTLGKNVCFPVLTEVVFGLNILAGHGVSFPVLRKVGKDLAVEMSTDLGLDALEEVVGKMDSDGEDGLYLPRLKLVNGQIWKGFP